MVGNDVVDLRDPESSPETLHPRFDSRVFTVMERESIEDSEESMRQRWRLWAAKEAAYKLARKRVPTTVFSPSRFEVLEFIAHDDLASLEAIVAHGVDRFRVAFTENECALHAVAVREGESRESVLSGWRRLESCDGDSDAPSRAARELLCERVAARLGVATGDLEVRRRERIPQLWLRGRPAPVDLSLSHHGGWLAFACQFEDRAGAATS